MFIINGTNALRSFPLSNHRFPKVLHPSEPFYCTILSRAPVAKLSLKVTIRSTIGLRLACGTINNLRLKGELANTFFTASVKNVIAVFRYAQYQLTLALTLGSVP